MKPGINEWFGIEMLEERPLEPIEPNHLVEEPEEQVDRLTQLIKKVTNDRLLVGWRLIGMSSEGPIYRLILDGRPTVVRTSVGKRSFTKEVADLVAVLNGWDRSKLMWYHMGVNFQLRLGFTNVRGCYNDMPFEEAVAAAVEFAGVRRVELC